MGKRHEGRIAVITGAAGGLMQPFVIRLAKEGCHLALTDREPCTDIAERIKEYDREVYHEQCDLSSTEAVDKFVKNVLNRFKGVDILVNNAAFQDFGDLEHLDLETFRLYLKVNMEAPFLLCKGFVPSMAARCWGRIVNMTSGTVNSPVPGMLGYSTTKMGIIGMTRCLAVELGEKGITVNALTPSLTRHFNTQKVFSDDQFEMVAQTQQAIKRTAVPEDIVGALAFLTSDDAAFMTGQTLAVDGGLTFF